MRSSIVSATGNQHDSPDTAQSATSAPIDAAPVDPVDAWRDLHSDVLATAETQPVTGENASGRLEDLRRLASWRTLEPKLEWTQWYLLVGSVLLVGCLAAGTVGVLVGWTIAALTMTAWSLVGLTRTARRRLVVAGAVLLAALLLAWRLDAHTRLGALAMVGTRDVVIAISILTALLGALTGTQRWLVLQSGIWCMALAASGWWLTMQSRSLSLLSEWRGYLPNKQVSMLLAAPITEPFDSGGVLWLTLASVTLFATSAFAGLVIGDLLRKRGIPVHRSALIAIVLGVWLGGLLTPDGWKMEMGILLLLLAAIAGTRAGSVRELIWLPGALVAGVLTREALAVAWEGLPAWWGPATCNEFLFSDCRPSTDLFALIGASGLLIGAAAVGYYGGHWFTHRNP